MASSSSSPTTSRGRELGPARLLLALVAVSASLAAHAADPIRVFAAGSLKAPLTEVARLYTAQTHLPIAFEFGASGLLRERLAKGERADVFASANMEHPRSLESSGLAGEVRLFARNRLCALAPAKSGLTTANLLDRLLDPAVKVGTSTPKADPSGDYAWQVFERAESARPGAFRKLSEKALQLTGGPASPPPPRDRSVYAELVTSGKADVFLTYCTNARAAASEDPALAVVALPESLAVGADYGIVVMRNASAQGAAFADFVLGPQGRDVLSAAGFAVP